MEKLIDALRYANPETFGAQLAQASAKERHAVLETISSAGYLECDRQIDQSNFCTNLEGLAAGFTGREQHFLEKTLIENAGHSNPAVFGILLKRTENPDVIENAMLKATGKAAFVDDECAARNLQAMLRIHAPSKERLLEMLEMSVRHGSPEQLGILLNHAAKQPPEGFAEALAESSLVKKALTAAHAGNKDARFNVSTVREPMTRALLEAGALPPSAIGGIELTDFLSHEGFGDATYQLAANMLRKQHVGAKGPGELRRPRRSAYPEPQLQLLSATQKGETRAIGEMENDGTPSHSRAWKKRVDGYIAYHERTQEAPRGAGTGAAPSAAPQTDGREEATSPPVTDVPWSEIVKSVGNKDNRLSDPSLPTLRGHK